MQDSNHSWQPVSHHNCGDTCMNKPSMFLPIIINYVELIKMMRNDDPAVYGTLFCAHTANINDAYSVKHRIYEISSRARLAWPYPASPLCPPPG